MKFKEALGYVADLFVPRLCVVCGKTLINAEEAEMCLECYVQLPRTNLHKIPVSASSCGGNPVQEKLAGILPLKYGAAWFYYNRFSPHSSLVKNAKYSDRPGVGRKLGRAYAKEIIADVPAMSSEIDVLLPLPMHWFKQLRRGYNQSRQIALGLSDVLGIPVGDNLIAIRPHSSQTRSSAAQRQQNVKGIFSVSSPEELNGLNIAVVDDVITTGSTITEAVQTLLRQTGAKSVSIFALGTTRLF